jgi:hypothetical protein
LAAGRSVGGTIAASAAIAAACIGFIGRVGTVRRGSDSAAIAAGRALAAALAVRPICAALANHLIRRGQYTAAGDFTASPGKMFCRNHMPGGGIRLVLLTLGVKRDRQAEDREARDAKTK